MTKLQTVKRNIDTEDKKEFKIFLPYLWKYSSKCEKTIKTALHKHLPNFKLTFVYRASTRLSSLFKFKDRIPQYLSADILYRLMCSKCNFAYIGETERYVKTRFCEHLVISALTGKNRKMQIPTKIEEHIACCKSENSLENFEIIGHGGSNATNRRIKESLFIFRDDPELNVQGNSVPLALFAK